MVAHKSAANAEKEQYKRARQDYVLVQITIETNFLCWPKINKTGGRQLLTE